MVDVADEGPGRIDAPHGGADGDRAAQRPQAERAGADERAQLVAPRAGGEHHEVGLDRSAGRLDAPPAAASRRDRPHRPRPFDVPTGTDQPAHVPLVEREHIDLSRVVLVRGGRDQVAPHLRTDRLGLLR